MGRDDENEDFVGWALPTVFPVFMRLSWWAEPTLLKSCWDDAYVGQQWVCPLLNESDLIDVDLAKSVFQLAIADKRCRITGSKRQGADGRADHGPGRHDVDLGAVLPLRGKHAFTHRVLTGHHELTKVEFAIDDLEV